MEYKIFGRYTTWKKNGDSYFWILENAFNKLNFIKMLLAVRYLWPTGARYSLNLLQSLFNINKTKYKGSRHPKDTKSPGIKQKKIH